MSWLTWVFRSHAAYFNRHEFRTISLRSITATVLQRCRSIRCRSVIVIEASLEIPNFECIIPVPHVPMPTTGQCRRKSRGPLGIWVHATSARLIKFIVRTHMGRRSTLCLARVVGCSKIGRCTHRCVHTEPSTIDGPPSRGTRLGEWDQPLFTNVVGNAC